MKHVVIGGSGFTGGYLAKELVRRGHNVVICDSNPNTSVSGADFIEMDIRNPEALRAITLQHDDVVHLLVARQYHAYVPKKGRQEFFREVNVNGTENVLKHMAGQGCHQLIYFSTDMVYGYPNAVPIDTAHSRNPLGPYGASKKEAEDLCGKYRDQGFRITIFRPRLIVGPGRLGVLTKLFSLIEKNLPVPLIGNGSNHYQMVSVFDCVSAVTCAVAKGIPDEEYNLGSQDPPTVWKLLKNLIESSGSRSRLVKTPATIVKRTLDVLDRVGVTVLFKEQYEISNWNYLVDISKTIEQLDWQPLHNDRDMINEAFREYQAQRNSL